MISIITLSRIGDIFLLRRFNMTGQVPSYLVRNLVEVALSRTDPKPAKKTRSNKTLCLAIPSKSFKKQGNSLEDVKALLKLHRRFENDAERTIYNGMTKTERERIEDFNSGASNCGVLPKKGEAKQSYLEEIHSKLSLPSSPELPALPGTENSPKQLKYYPKKQLNFSEETRKKDKGVLPALADKPFHSGQNLPSNEQLLQENLKPKDFENLDEKSFGNFNLHEDLTIIPLNKKNFASYDSLTTLFGVRPKRSSRSDVGKSRNTKPPLGIFIPISETRSEDGLFVDFDEYLKDIADERSQASLREDGGNEHCELEGGGELTEQSLALVEYRPMYRRNVHFGEVLHEVHLYSPVQNHWRRRRRRSRHTEDDIEEPR